ncbi:hypothetical protein [Psychroflexus tropicus]|uniref:hypothetical protein n=1 Tax=Psychroflexus tropicus TaxID=197345 RepID=UPI0005272BF3|nr:hypothetical protein [Psychroflexus tropicus]
MFVVMFYGIFNESTKYDHLEIIVKSSNVNINVKKAEVDRTAVIINDTLIIPSYTRLANQDKNSYRSRQNISEMKFNISKISAPYLINKDSNSWIINLLNLMILSYLSFQIPMKEI